MRLTVEAVDVNIGSRPIVHDATIDVPEGTVAGLVGPNGSGKSTLLRAVYRHLRPRAGAVLVDGEDCWHMPARQAARRIASIPQERPVELELTVWEVVSMGRTPHKGPFARDNDADLRAITDALDRVGILDMSRRRFGELSGGEKQRVIVARALTQQAPVLVMDEPTNHLDIHHQLEVLELVRELRVTTLTAMHDLNLAATYCDRLNVLEQGKVVASGRPTEVLTEDLLARVFGVGAEITVSNRTGRPQLSFHPLGFSESVGPNGADDSSSSNGSASSSGRQPQIGEQRKEVTSHDQGSTQEDQEPVPGQSRMR